MCIEFAKAINLHMIRVRIGTFSFDKITRGVKANTFDKLSHFGGTAGLFNGFSFISLCELFILFFTLLIQYFPTFFKKMENRSNVVEVKEFQANKNGKSTCDIERQLNDMSQKCDIFEREYIMYRCKADEDSQKIDAMEKRLAAVKKELIKKQK